MMYNLRRWLNNRIQVQEQNIVHEDEREDSSEKSMESLALTSPNNKQWNYPSCRQWGWTMSASPFIPLLWGFWNYKPTMPSYAAAKNVSKESSKTKSLCKMISTKLLVFFKWKWQALSLNPSFFKPLSLERNKGNHMKPIFKLLLAWLCFPS